MAPSLMTLEQDRARDDVFPHQKLSSVKCMFAAATANNSVAYVSSQLKNSPVKNYPREILALAEVCAP